MDYELRTIGEGWTGTDDTVEQVYRLVNEAILDPVVVLEARNIVRYVPERDKDAESRAISAYVRKNLRYTKESVETLTAPATMIREIHKYGNFTEDCDGATLLWLTLHRAIGFQVRARVISQRKDGMASHIFGQVQIADRWVTDDTICKNKPYGWEPPAKSMSNSKEYGVQGPEEFGEGDEGRPMSEMNVTVHGPIRKMRSDMFQTSKRMMIGRSVSSRGFQLKPTGMIYVDRQGGLSGVGMSPNLGQVETVVNVAASAGKAIGKLFRKKKKAKAAAAAAPKPERQLSTASMFGGQSGTLLLAGGAAALLWALFGPKKRR